MEPVALGGFPFDSQITGYQPDGLPIYDRASNSEEFASLIKGFWRDGVFGTDALTVLAGSGMTATVGAGSILIQGRVAKIASPKTVNFETANSQPRFDIVVARRDLSNAVRDIVLDVVKGVPATTPVVPSPVRNATIWDLCLAIVKIPANVGMVQQQNITDTRLDKNLCGIVAATMTDVDTSRFYEQIQADLSYFREEEQAQFDSWFDSLKDVLDENAAGNLYNKIENLTAEDVGARPADWMPSLNDVAFLGLNPIAGVENDTVENWVALGSGYCRYNVSGLLESQPTQYGFLITYHIDNDIFQLWKAMPTGEIYYRSGNESGWGSTWNMLLTPGHQDSKVLWEGSWESGSINVPRTDKYSLFQISMSGQGTAIIGVRQSDYIRGIGGYSSATPTIMTYHFAANIEGNKWTLVACNSMQHKANGNHGEVTEIVVRNIVGLL